MNQQRENKKYLPGVYLPEGLSVTTDLAAVLADVDYVVLAVPSQVLRETLEKVKVLLPAKAVLINTAKGLEVGTKLRMSQVVEQVIPDSQQRFVALYGPSHAEEVGRGLPAAVVSCSINAAAAEAVQDLFMSPNLRVYTNHDLIGVEIGGAIKNIHCYCYRYCHWFRLGR